MYCVILRGFIAQTCDKQMSCQPSIYNILLIVDKSQLIIDNCFSRQWFAVCTPTSGPTGTARFDYRPALPHPRDHRLRLSSGFRLGGMSGAIRFFSECGLLASRRELREPLAKQGTIA